MAAATGKGRGSTANVVAALLSFLMPGLGQLVQGRLIKAVLMFFLACLPWIILMGWIIHIWSAWSAARFKP